MGRIMVWWCLSVRVSVRPSVSFLHFSRTRFDMLSWNFVCHFLLMNIRSSSSAGNFSQFCRRNAPFGTLNPGNTQFPHFFPTYFEILSWIIAYVFVILNYRSSTNVVNLHQCLKEVYPFWNLEYWKYSFPHFSPACFDILSWIWLLNCTTDQVRVSSILELRILEIKFSALFCCMIWHIGLKFRIWLFDCSKYQVQVSSISVNFCWSYVPFGTLNPENI